MRKGLIFGLVALFTIFAFTMVSCGGTGGGGNPVPGLLQINSGEGSVVAPVSLVATHTDIDDVEGTITYQWYRNNLAVDGKTDLSFGMVGPGSAGTYTITAKLDGYDDTSVSITVTAPEVQPPETDTALSQNIKDAIQEVVDDGGYVERVSLLGGAFAIYKFELGDAQWGDYDKITVDYMVDSKQLTKGMVNTRLYGVYTDITTPGAQFNGLDTYGEFTVDPNGALVARQDGEGGKTKAQNNRFHPYIMVGLGTSVLGSVSAEEWFTLSYTLPTTTTEGGFNSLPGTEQEAPDAFDAEDLSTYKGNLPDGTYGTLRDTGDFWVGVGISGGGSNDKTETNAIEQWIANVTLVHKSDPTKNIVSQGSGLEGEKGNLAQVFLGYIDSFGRAYRGPANAKIRFPKDLAYVPPKDVPAYTADQKIIDFGSTSTATKLSDITGLAQAGSPTITVASGVITVAGRSLDWHALDIVVDGQLAPARDKYKIEIEGEITFADGADKAVMALRQSNGAYTTYKSSDPVVKSGAETKGSYSITLDEVPSTVPFTSNIRIQSVVVKGDDPNPDYSADKVAAAAAFATAWEAELESKWQEALADTTLDPQLTADDEDDWKADYEEANLEDFIASYNTTNTGTDAYDPDYDLTIPATVEKEIPGTSTETFTITKLVVTYLGANE